MRSAPAPSATSRSARSGLDVLQQLRVVVRLAGSHSLKLERASGVPGAQLWALHEIASANGLTVGELAAQLRIHQTTVTNLLNKLEAQEMVLRERSPHDRRVVHIRITPTGRKALRRVPGLARGLLPRVLDEMSPAQLRKVHAGLAVLVDCMGGFDPALAAKPLPFNE